MPHNLRLSPGVLLAKNLPPSDNTKAAYAQRMEAYMPLRGKSLPKLCLGFLLVTFPSTFALASPTTQPASPSKLIHEDEKGGAGQLGAVQEAMKYMYSVPRKSAKATSPKPLTRANAAKPRRANAVTSKPAIDDDNVAVVEPGESVIGYPGPYYYETRPRRLPEHRRRFSEYRYFEGQPGRYGYGRNDYFGDDYSGAGEVYRFGFNRGYDRARFDDESNDRTDAVLKHFSGHLGRALTLFNQGRYREAADAFRLAADTHQGDPSARLYAAHALFAIGRYHEAVGYLRRAFELQPRIVFLTFDIRNDYGQRGDFAQQLADLEAAVDRSPANCDRLLLLGYIRYYSDQRDRAYTPLAGAYKLNRRDTLVKQLLSNSRPPDVALESQK